MLEVSVARYGKDSLGTLRPFRVLTQTQVQRRMLLFTTDPQRASCLHTQWVPCRWAKYRSKCLSHSPPSQTFPGTPRADGPGCGDPQTYRKTQTEGHPSPFTGRVGMHRKDGG